MDLARERVGPAPISATPDPAALDDLTASGRLLRRVVANWDPKEPFGPSDIAAEVNRRYRSQLRKPIRIRAASNLLRRMYAEGRITLVRPGKAFSESLYRHGGS